MNRIKDFRKSLGLTQDEFAQKLGCKRATFAHYENGRRSPNLEMCRKVVATFRELGTSLNIDDVFPPKAA